jgi:anti-sigma factor RsiW
MTGQIIRFQGDQHREVQSLLPWYLTGRLEDTDRVRVEAHLDACAECQAELKSERHLAEEIASLSAAETMHDVEHGWARIRRDVELKTPRRARVWSPPRWLSGGLAGVGRQWRGSALSLRWVVAAQFGLLVLVASALLVTSVQPARYRALGARPAVASGNVVVIFRPDIREMDLRATLIANGARVVDGPTAADAYLLHVPTAERTAALTRLRKSARVELAEPVDAGAQP